MPQSVPHGAVIYAKNSRVLAGFYQQMAGLAQREAEKEYVLLEGPSFQLVIHQIPERFAASITIETPPRKRESAAIKLTFPVSSIQQARQVARNLGGELNGPDREWTFHGVNHCDGIDPEGNVFQLTEALPS